MADPHASHRSAWLLDPDVLYLNHGSFGACPRAVLDEQARLREALEREPVRFLARELPDRLDAARAELARFVGSDPRDVVFVRNATAAANAVLASLSLAAGDELLTTDHEYNACRNVLEHAAARTGARVVTAPVPFPLRSAGEVLETVLSRVGPRTRLVFLDHVTSPTALVLPVGELVRELARRGVDTFVDGAHAPGMLPLDLEALGAAYYTGNCHKWLCAPKGAGFLRVRRDRQAGLHPSAISHGLSAPTGGRSRFQVEFDWTGTDDPTPALCVPAAIRALAGLVPGGWDEVRARNHALCLAARDRVAAALGVAAPAPDELLGAMAALPLPDGAPQPPPPPLHLDPLQDRLYFEHRIEIPVVLWPAPPRRLLRLSAQLYNELADYEHLARALVSCLSG